jgi:hypothetical protein
MKLDRVFLKREQIELRALTPSMVLVTYSDGRTVKVIGKLTDDVHEQHKIVVAAGKRG